MLLVRCTSSRTQILLNPAVVIRVLQARGGFLIQEDPDPGMELQG